MGKLVDNGAGLQKFLTERFPAQGIQRRPRVLVRTCKNVPMGLPGQYAGGGRLVRWAGNLRVAQKNSGNAPESGVKIATEHFPKKPASVVVAVTLHGE